VFQFYTQLRTALSPSEEAESIRGRVQFLEFGVQGLCVPDCVKMYDCSLSLFPFSDFNGTLFSARGDSTSSQPSSSST
jgi:hypothetical protein